ncbi:MAG: hypothetical protein GF383_01105 [Candidatus Lokiarchaeota archaeon]|nr:hypothetical protein [Candidatus Lokiarchaeota archaeon]MBD3337839.1 hypothetical protein [Candidatus Lokiarchaeota archaeon]
MIEYIKEINNLLDDENEIDKSKIKEMLDFFLKEYVRSNQINEYIGDFPTFIEPVFLGKNVEIGDDVLLGPNVYIGDNCEISDYVELSNAVILDNVKIGENFTLENCLVKQNSKLDFTDLNVENCIILGSANSQESVKKIEF